MAHRFFGTWLAACTVADGPIQDLRSDLLLDCRRLKVTPKHFREPFDLYHRMVGQQACSEAIDALRQAADLYGQPLPSDEELEELELERDLAMYQARKA